MSDDAKSPSAAQSIDILQKRFGSLNTRKIEAERDLKHATESLQALQQEAREKYGTDDVEALRLKLAEMKAENEAKRAAYQESLDRIEADLSAVEAKFAADGAAASGSEPS